MIHCAQLHTKSTCIDWLTKKKNNKILASLFWWMHGKQETLSLLCSFPVVVWYFLEEFRWLLWNLDKITFKSLPWIVDEDPHIAFFMDMDHNTDSDYKWMNSEKLPTSCFLAMNTGDKTGNCLKIKKLEYSIMIEHCNITASKHRICVISTRNDNPWLAGWKGLAYFLIHWCFTFVLICLGVSVRKMDELGSLALILVWAPCRAGKNVEWMRAGLG